MMPHDTIFFLEEILAKTLVTLWLAHWSSWVHSTIEKGKLHTFANLAWWMKKCILILVFLFALSWTIWEELVMRKSFGHKMKPGGG